MVSASASGCIVQGQASAADTSFLQEQAAAKQSTRMSDAATTSAAMQSFDVSSLNPTDNNVRSTQQFYGQVGSSTIPATHASGSLHARDQFSMISTRLVSADKLLRIASHMYTSTLPARA